MIQFDYMMAILSCGNFSKAAKQLGISQPALSTHIKKIEEQLGITIFDRTVKPLKLTEEGEIYLNYVRRKSQLEQQFQERLHCLKEQESGHRPHENQHT